MCVVVYWYEHLVNSLILFIWTKLVPIFCVVKMSNTVCPHNFRLLLCSENSCTVMPAQFCSTHSLNETRFYFHIQSTTTVFYFYFLTPLNETSSCLIKTHFLRFEIKGLSYSHLFFRKQCTIAVFYSYFLRTLERTRSCLTTF